MAEVEKSIEDRNLDVLPPDQVREDVAEEIDDEQPSALVLTEREWRDLATMARLFLAVVGDDRHRDHVHARRARLADRILAATAE